jgi:glycosyltransferase involved in cell wall biosynthesis
VVIGIDYTAAAWQGAGIGRYTRELVRATVARGEANRYVLFYAAGGLPKASPYIAQLGQLCREYAHVTARPIGLTPRQLTILWQRLRLPLRAELFCGPLDVLHSPDFVLPPTRARTLLTVHDLSFQLFDDVHLPKTRDYLRRALPHSLRRADAVIADSESTKRDLLRLMGLAERQVSVIYSGADPSFRPLAPEELAGARERLGLPARFLLHVGTLEPRKNLVRLVEAFARLGRPELDLLLVGRRGWMDEPIFAAVARHGLGARVRCADFVADTDLPLLYNLCEAFVYPSLYEGFGLPPLEALACATPVVTSQVSSLPEVVGEAALLVDPYDTAAIAAGIARVLDDAELAARLRREGPRQAARFGWERAATQLLACYEAVGFNATRRKT